MVRAKPKLTIDEQIEHLENLGVRFDVQGKEAAAEDLRRLNFFKLTSYRKLFDKRTSGERKGTYINLDFAYLKHLADVDRLLRKALLGMTLDVEVSAKARLMAEIERRPEEDGYEIVANHFEAMGPARKGRFEAGLSAKKGDVYCGELILKYQSELPAWVLLEVCSFGEFISFYRFCAERWKDDALVSEHYLLKQTKSVRNACAHNQCMANGFTSSGQPATLRPSRQVMQKLSAAGVPKTTRRSKMSNARFLQVAMLLEAFSALVEDEAAIFAARTDFNLLFNGYEEHADYYWNNNTVKSAFAFLAKMVDIWL